MNNERWTQVHKLLASATRGAGTGYTNAISVKSYHEALFFMECTAVGGSSTLDLTMQVSPDDGATWFDTASVFVQSTGAVKRLLSSIMLGPLVRFSYTVAGTNTPTATFYLSGSFKT